MERPIRRIFPRNWKKNARGTLTLVLLKRKGVCVCLCACLHEVDQEFITNHRLKDSRWDPRVSVLNGFQRWTSDVLNYFLFSPWSEEEEETLCPCDALCNISVMCVIVIRLFFRPRFFYTLNLFYVGLWTSCRVSDWLLSGCVLNPRTLSL